MSHFTVKQILAEANKANTTTVRNLNLLSEAKSKQLYYIKERNLFLTEAQLQSMLGAIILEYKEQVGDRYKDLKMVDDTMHEYGVSSEQVEAIKQIILGSDQYKDVISLFIESNKWNVNYGELDLSEKLFFYISWQAIPDRAYDAIAEELDLKDSEGIMQAYSETTSSLIYKHPNNEKFYIKIDFDETGGVKSVDNQWDVHLPQHWVRYGANMEEVKNFFTKKYPDYYIEGDQMSEGAYKLGGANIKQSSTPVTPSSNPIKKES